ncbi:metallophosphoesterase [Erwinia billingiae]|jgi:predicted MPP superfamily phosphohydrolase|uniref:metallophosphoesterase n=1 Tax=Erwinia billingiae TaxID=182337 RepID=UPI00069E240F|nr:metallophosphoesterase [Erwinia billingiae]
MFHLIFSLPSLYVITRFIGPMPWPLSVRLATALLLLIASQYHLFCRFSSGSVFAPEMPRFIVILFNWAFCAIFLIALMQIATDAVTLISLIVQHKIAILPGYRYTIGLIAVVLSAYGVHQAIRVPPVKNITVEVSGLPAEFEGYKIVQLTDMHISRLFPASWSSAVVKKANGLGADLIAITGDVIDGTVNNRRKDVEPLRDLSAPDGVYVITGNHEYFFEQKKWTEHLIQLGMKSLPNKHAVINRNGAKLLLAGVNDISASNRSSTSSDLDQALENAPVGAPIILLDHQPRNARQAAARGVQLQLSGHTHGGLISGLDRFFAPANGGFVSGFYDVEGMTLYVNNGTGLWPGMALRLGRPSELTLITLKARRSEPAKDALPETVALASD